MGLLAIHAAAAQDADFDTGWAEPDELDPRVIDLGLEAPRPFGVLVGDRVRHTVTLTLPDGFRLQSSTLPAVRRIGDWLDLQDVVLRERGIGDSVKYRLTLEYQVFHTPLGVDLRTIPDFTLRVAGPEGGFPVKIPAWTFAMSPLLQRDVAHEGENVVPMRPDRPAPLIDPAPWRWGLAVFGISSLLLIAYLLYRFLPIGRRGGAPFAQARRRLRRLRRAPLDEQRLREGFRVVHQAFNQTAGRALFADQLDRFFEHYPSFTARRAAIERFFGESRRLFFGGGEKLAADRAEWTRIETLCRECHAAERGVV